MRCPLRHLTRIVTYYRATYGSYLWEFLMEVSLGSYLWKLLREVSYGSYLGKLLMEVT